MPLPDNTKYLVANHLRDMVTNNMSGLMLHDHVELERMDVTQISPLVLNIRFKPRDGSGPRYITIQVSESW